MPDLLPDEFRFAHEFAFFLHNRLVHILTRGEREDAYGVKITLRSKTKATEFTNLSREHLWKWLKENGHDQSLRELAYKQVFAALLSDFSHFIFEALDCSRKGKLTVTYALLRKPLRDNLHYLEWLLVDPENFIDVFQGEVLPRMDLQRAKALVEKSVARVPNHEMFDPEVIYRLRFESGHVGLDGICDQALHLVTHRSDIATEVGNFNFVFSNTEDNLNQWRHIYFTVPYLLDYTVDLCEVLIASVMGQVLSDYPEIALRRFIGLIVWSQDLATQPTEVVQALPQPRIQEMPLVCSKCSKPIEPQLEDLRRFFIAEYIKCPHCRRRLRLSDLSQ